MRITFKLYFQRNQKRPLPAVKTKNKSVLITGINGKLGKSLQQLFLSKGFEVKGTCRSPNKNEGDFYLNLGDPHAAEQLIEACLAQQFFPDLLILNAADTRTRAPQNSEIETYCRVNLFSQIEIAEAVLKISEKTYVIFISSILAHLDDHLNPFYHQCKKQVETELSDLEKLFPGRVGFLIPGPLKKNTLNPLFGTYKGAAIKVFRCFTANEKRLFYPFVWKWIAFADLYLGKAISYVLPILRKA